MIAVSKSRATLLTLLLGVLALGACSTQVRPGCYTRPVEQPAGPYRIHTGDRIELRIFGEDFADGEYLVASSGSVSLPLVGSIDAVGLTIDEFIERVRQVYTGELVSPPRVNAQIVASRPYYVLGEVKQPGSFAYQYGITALAAVATAGGFTTWARKDCVLLRPGDGSEEYYLRTDVNLQLAPGDVILVESF